jgi:tetratricopeptide (TPR) repeat protein
MGGADEPASRASPAIEGYEILGELGRGGMGVVYRARQVQLNRPCALKMILAGAHANPEAVARFLAEARAIARLQHVHIVQIHHIGKADDLPFFELEYVPGGGLDRQIEGTPWQPRRAARLVEQLARAMAEAHRLGVVHRDLKPANVLLAADGTPKITDFGLAKMVDSESGLTRTELVMGSPSYMAPEQAEGRAKESRPSVDVYALGAILYELLTGRPPFRGATAMETLEQVKGSEPVPPLRLVPNLARDIETICLKCLRKEPTRRYEDASALAEDLRRFRSGEPIVARRISGAERAWRWCRRNPVIAGLTAAVAGLVLAVAVVSLVSAARLGRALADAKDNLGRAQQEEANAMRSASESKAVLAFVRDKILAAARPEGQEGGLGRQVTLRAAVDAAERSIAAGFVDQPTVEAAIRGALGTSYFHLGEPAMAIRQQDRAWALLAAALGPGHPDTLKSLNELADAFLLAGRIAESIPRYEEALNLRKARLGPGHLETLDTMGDLAAAYHYAGRIGEAIPLAEETLRLKEAGLGPDHLRTLTTMRFLAESYRAAGRTDDAIALYEEAIRRLRATAGPEHPDVLRTMALLALGYQDAGRLVEAISLGEKALKLQEAKLGPDNFVMLQSRDYLATAYRAAGRTDEAIALHESALKGLRAKMGPDNHETLHSMNNLAGAYQDAGRRGEALPLFEEALRLRRVTLGRDHPDTLKSMANLAGAYQDAGRRDEALPLFEEALKLCKTKLGLGHPLTLTAMNYVAAAYLDARRWAGAEALARDALTRRERALPDDWRRFHTMSQLGTALAGQAKYAEAEPLLIGGYEGLEARQGKIPAPAKKYLAAAEVRIVPFYEAWGKFKEAARWREKLRPRAEADEPRE